MINTTTKYIVYNHNGSGVRHHHFTSSNDIIGATTGSASPGDSLPALGFAFQQYMGQTVPFAFMSVHGAADGNHLYTSPGTPSVPVGNTDIDILVVYAPPGGFGGPDGGPGVWVDAFNVNTGEFSDALDFIEVLTPPTPPDSVDAPKTTFANMEGVVSTLSGENLRANVSVDGGVPFLEWKKIVPTEAIQAGRDVSLAQNETNEIWFAFYKTVPPAVSIPDLRDRLGQALGKWVDDDYCGTPWPHKIGPHGPAFQVSLPESVMRTLTAAQKEKLGTASKKYASVAKGAYGEMTKVIGLLTEIANIASKAKGK
jgi:hypothetical protein